MSKGEAGMGYYPFLALGHDQVLGSRQIGCQELRVGAATRATACDNASMRHDIGAIRA